MPQSKYTPRQINGILLLDKTLGLSSNKALQRAKTIFQADKAGHTGSLDPLATGMLPICFGAATKFSQFLLGTYKRYQVKVILGITTTTGDAEGEIISQSPYTFFTKQQLEQKLMPFRGKILQTPPMYSALKHNGKPLYKYAREGINIDRISREVIIHRLILTQYIAPALYLDVVCSKGTYIRTLAEDIGNALGCGAHVGELRRLRVGQFPMEKMVTLDMLKTQCEQEGIDSLKKYLLPISTACQSLPVIEITNDEWQRLIYGQLIHVEETLTVPHYRLIVPFSAESTEKRFVGVGKQIDEHQLGPCRILR